jgi:hypothetical protein
MAGVIRSDPFRGASNLAAVAMCEPLKPRNATPVRNGFAGFSGLPSRSTLGEGLCRRRWLELIDGEHDVGNSPYTKALAQTIRRAGTDIFQTFNEVRFAQASTALSGAQLGDDAENVGDDESCELVRQRSPLRASAARAEAAEHATEGT